MEFDRVQLNAFVRYYRSRANPFDANSTSVSLFRFRCQQDTGRECYHLGPSGESNDSRISQYNDTILKCNKSSEANRLWFAKRTCKLHQLTCSVSYSCLSSASLYRGGYRWSNGTLAGGKSLDRLTG